MSKLTSKERNTLPNSDFAGPDRSYPVDTANRARNALARVHQFGTPEEIDKVRAKVRAKFPHILQEHIKQHGQSTHDFLRSTMD